MTERPIIFSSESVNAILSGRKTQTRRVINRSNSLVDGSSCRADHWDELHFEHAFVDPGPSPAGNEGPYLHVDCGGKVYQHDGARHRVYPRYWRGDRLWVRETWRPVMENWQSFIEYQDGRIMNVSGDLFDPQKLKRIALRFDGARKEFHSEAWHSPIHMLRWASRLWLEVTGVRAERLQAISLDDICAEGVNLDDNRDFDEAEHFMAGGSPVEGGSPERFAFASAWDRINGKRTPWASNPWTWVICFKVVKEVQPPLVQQT